MTILTAGGTGRVVARCCLGRAILRSLGMINGLIHQHHVCNLLRSTLLDPSTLVA